MCSTNPGNWVTFDDDPTFQSSQKSKNFHPENQGTCRPNRLKLNLSTPKEFSSGSSSTNSTPLPSPIIDFYFSPGPPSNSPLSTPTKDFPGIPGFPKAGTHVLYPIPELSSNNPLTTPTADSSLVSTKPACVPHASLPKDHSCAPSAPKVGLPDEVSPPQAESLGFQCEAPQFQYFQEDCAFSSPFWKEEGNASQFTFEKGTPSSGKDMTIYSKS